MWGPKKVHWALVPITPVMRVEMWVEGPVYVLCGQRCGNSFSRLRLTDDRAAVTCLNCRDKMLVGG
jgi:hypothetical protein